MKVVKSRGPRTDPWGNCATIGVAPQTRGMIVILTEDGYVEHDQN